MQALVQICCAAVDPDAPILAYIQARQRIDLLVESAGLFWIAAELIVLFLVRAGKRHIETEPLPERFALTRVEKVWAVAWAVGFALLALLVLGRHFLTARIDPADATATLSANLHMHLSTWAGFVTAWVVLEMLIVYHGWRGYRRLRHLLGNAPARAAIPLVTWTLVICVLGLYSWRAVGLDVDTVRQAIREANKADQVYWNALYLYLRVAGIVWIVVEWWAALILFKGYRLLSRAAAMWREAS